MRIRAIAVASVAVCCLTFTASCSADSSGGHKGSGSSKVKDGGSKKSSNKSSKKSGKKSSDKGAGADTGKAGMDDVEITSCEVDSLTGMAAAKMTITNRSSKTSNYMVQVEFLNGSGTRVGEGMAGTNNLAAKQETKLTAQGFEQIKGSVKCKITDVTRYAAN